VAAQIMPNLAQVYAVQLALRRCDADMEGKAAPLSTTVRRLGAGTIHSDQLVATEAAECSRCAQATGGKATQAVLRPYIWGRFRPAGRGKPAEAGFFDHTARKLKA